MAPKFQRQIIDFRNQVLLTGFGRMFGGKTFNMIILIGDLGEIVLLHNQVIQQRTEKPKAWMHLKILRQLR